ncbi:MAG: methyltransferase domain-containing protein [Flavobacteriales bacterium]|nr:methyltransferase domain-containing protein [Flavobacteriales bacterium]
MDRIARRGLSPFAYERLHDLKGELKAMWVHRRGVREARKRTWTPGVKLNIGCGPVITPGYVRVDFCPGVDVRVDLRRPLPIPDAIADVILCEHFLEHLRYPGQAHAFLKQCHRLLRPGGQLLLSVPDTRWPMECYVHGRTEWQDACKANKWHPQWVTTTMEHLNYHFRQQDDDRTDGHFECHRFAYDAETLEKVLRKAGFATVERRAFEPGLDAPHREIGSLFMGARK